MLVASFLITLALLSAEDTKPATAEMKVYKSSRLGFSIHYPATWEKLRGGSSCGSGQWGLTAAERLKRPVHPVIFRPPNEAYAFDGLSVKVHRKFEDPITKHLDLMRPHRLGFRRVVSDFEFGAGLIGKKVRLGPRRTTYVLLADHRLIELTAHCARSSEFERLEHTFDSMAKTLNLLPLLDGKVSPGTFHTYVGASFSFEYPADWTVSGSYDDEKNIGAGVDQSLFIYAPVDPHRSMLNVRTYVGCSQYPLHPDEKATIDDYIIETKRLMALIKGETSFRYEAYETQHGQKGIKYWYVVKLPLDVEMNFVGWVMPTRLGRLQVLGFQYAPEQHDELGPIFEHVGRSFVVN